MTLLSRVKRNSETKTDTETVFPAVLLLVISHLTWPTG